MEPALSSRRGVTLIELLVVLALVAVLLGLLLPAVLQVRERGYRAESQNNLRQLILAVHHYADSNGQRLPLVDMTGTRIGKSLLVSILPFVERRSVYDQFRSGPQRLPPVALFISPADPTAAEGLAQGHQVSSYAANAQLFQGGPRVSVAWPDGASHTIAFAEHYAYDCQGTIFYYWHSSLPSTSHRATFADALGIVPVTRGQPPISGPSARDFTFQVAPSRRECLPLVAQTPHRSGMLVAMADGSGRILAPGMASSTYWAAVTPSSGDRLGDDW